jgi:hypothetical protein
MADFVGFMKGQRTLKAACVSGQAQCSMKNGENVPASAVRSLLRNVSAQRRLSQLNDN